MKLQVTFNDGTNEDREFESKEDYNNFIAAAPYAIIMVGDVFKLTVTKIVDPESGKVLYDR